MAIKSLAPYEFPSRSAVENYGGNMMVNLLRRDSVLYCCGSTVLVPPDMKWKDFVETQVKPYVEADPDFKGGEWVWKLVDEDFNPDDDKSLEENGIRHKMTVSINVK